MGVIGLCRVLDFGARRLDGAPLTSEPGFSDRPKVGIDKEIMETTEGSSATAAGKDRVVYSPASPSLVFEMKP